MGSKRLLHPLLCDDRLGLAQTSAKSNSQLYYGKDMSHCTIAQLYRTRSVVESHALSSFY